MYKVEKKGNTLIIETRGFFSQQEGDNFIADYKKTLATIDPQKTNLILDGADLKTSAQDVIPILKNCISMYLEDKFNKVLVVEFKSTLTQSQVMRLCKETGFDKRIIMVKSIEEGLKQSL